MLKPLQKHYPPKRNPALLFLLPSLLGILLLVLLPFSDAIRRSFFNAMGSSFVGFSNYKSVLDNDAFRLAAANTAKFIVVCIPLLLGTSLLLSLLVRFHKKGARAFKTTYLLPMAIPVSSIVILWQVFFHKQGLANNILCALGGKPIDFMGTNAAFWVLIFTYIWKNCGYDMILFLAGLDGIPVSHYEAAKMDGASSWQSFRYITLPELMPTFFLVSVLSLLNSFKVFREAYLVAGPYPHESIYLLQHLFNNWFSDLEIGRLCASAVLIAGAVLVLILLMHKAWNQETKA